jgi:hypothetical protein
MAIPLLNNGDSGFTARTIINNLVNTVNVPTGFPYTGSANVTGSVSITGSVNTTQAVVASIFMHPQIITSNITIPTNYNGFLVSPVSISSSITVETNANLIIL